MFLQRFKELREAFQSCIYSDREKQMSEMVAFEKTCTLIQETHESRGIVYFVGNGGSAGIASHFSNDLMKALKISSLTFFDSNLLTCISNDLGYENVFSYPLERVLKPNDLLIAISSSGKSQNILKAAQVALDRNVPLVTFSGFCETNLLREMGDVNFWINRNDYGLVETAHFFLLHTVVDLFNKQSVLEKKYAQVN